MQLNDVILLIDNELAKIAHKKHHTEDQTYFLQYEAQEYTLLKLKYKILHNNK